MSLAGKKIILRADGSHARGIGHVMRSMALGDGLHAVGAQLFFAAASLPQDLERRIVQRGYAIIRLGGGAAADLAALRDVRASWLVIDSYDIDAAERLGLAQVAPRTAVIDDVYNNGPYHADLVINPNPGATWSAYLPAPPGQRHAIGSTYVVLRPEIIAAKRARDFQTARKVFISCGGSDPYNAAQHCLDFLSEYDAAKLEIEVLMGPVAKDENIQNIVQQSPHTVRLLEATDAIEEHLNWADIALLAAGTTQWEAAYLGCPFIALVVADNQVFGAQHFADQGGSSMLDWRAARDAEVFLAAFERLCSNAKLRQERSVTAQRLIDGQGAQRLAALFV